MEGFPIRKPLQVDSDGLDLAGLDPLCEGRCTFRTCVHADVVTATNGRADQQPLLARHGPAREANEDGSEPSVWANHLQSTHMFSSVRLVSRFAAEMRNSPEIRREKTLPDCLPMTLTVPVGTRANLNCV